MAQNSNRSGGPERDLDTVVDRRDTTSGGNTNDRVSRRPLARLIAAIWSVGLLFPVASVTVGIASPYYRSILLDTARSAAIGESAIGDLEWTDCAWFKVEGARGADQGIECRLIVRTGSLVRNSIIRVSSAEQLHGTWTPGLVFGQVAVAAPSAAAWDRFWRVLPTLLIALGSIGLATIATAAAISDQRRLHQANGRLQKEGRALGDWH